MNTRNTLIAVAPLLVAQLLAEPALAAEGTPTAQNGAKKETASAEEEPPTSIPINRSWDVLAPVRSGRYRKSLKEAGELLGDWTIHLTAIPINGPVLVALAEESPEEPFLRLVREKWKRAIDLQDLFYFLDDILLAGQKGLRGKPVHVTGGRARREGILIHTDDIFRGRPRRYGRGDTIAIDKPQKPAELPPAADGDILGPNWSARFKNPDTEEEMLAALEAVNDSGTIVARLTSLIKQLKDQGVEVYLTSTERRRERGYLMWGAFILSRAKSESQLKGHVALLEKRKKEWGLNIPIKWEHPDGWEATKDAAREMADAYDVVYATEKGAKSSNHYGGRAIDIVGIGLPRTLELTGHDGAKHTFDFSHPNQPRDLSLTPNLIKWIERHFSLSKLRSDYPHWNDVAPKKKEG